MTDVARSRTGPAQASATPKPSLRQRAGALRRFLPTLSPFEQLFFGGLVLMALGLALIYPPLALLVPGAAISTVAVVLKLRGP